MNHVNIIPIENLMLVDESFIFHLNDAIDACWRQYYTKHQVIFPTSIQQNIEEKEEENVDNFQCFELTTLID